MLYSISSVTKKQTLLQSVLSENVLSSGSHFKISYRPYHLDTDLVDLTFCSYSRSQSVLYDEGLSKQEKHLPSTIGFY